MLDDESHYESLNEQFAEVAAVFVQRVLGLTEETWSAPGLGVWTVRELVGHTLRAFATVDNFLDNPGDSDAVLAAESAPEYFRIALSMTPDIHEQVARRGNLAGLELGDDPTAAVVDRVGITMGRLSGTDGSEVGATAIGLMRLVDYLPTRLVELVVHVGDLCVAAGEPLPDLGSAMLSVIDTVAASASPDNRTRVLRSMVGRDRLPDGFSVWP